MRPTSNPDSNPASHPRRWLPRAGRDALPNSNFNSNSNSNSTGCHVLDVTHCTDYPMVDGLLEAKRAPEAARDWL